MARRLVTVLALLTLVALLASCGSSATDDGVERTVDGNGAEADVDAEPIGTSPLEHDEGVDAALVEVTARWQCDRQRFAFESLDGIDTLLDDLRADAGVSAAEHEAFLDAMDADADLRLRVRAAFVEICA